MLQLVQVWLLKVVQWPPAKTIDFLWLDGAADVSDRNDSDVSPLFSLSTLPGVIVLAFVLCWLPFHVGRTIFFFTHDASFLYSLSQYVNLVSSVLFYLSAAINPLLYNLMSARYRHAVHSLLRTQSHTQSHRLRTLTAHQSTTTLSGQTWHTWMDAHAAGRKQTDKQTQMWPLFKS